MTERTRTLLKAKTIVSTIIGVAAIFGGIWPIAVICLGLAWWWGSHLL